MAPAAANEVTDEAQYIALINEIRAEAGLEPLLEHPELTDQARVWAIQLRSNDQLSHAGDLSVGVTGNWTKLGENVGVGPSDQLPAIFDAFVASPAHYANLMDPDFRFIGVGVVYDDEGRMWTAHRFMAVAPNDEAVVAAQSTDRQPDEQPEPEVLAFGSVDEFTEGSDAAQAGADLEADAANPAAADDGDTETVLLADLFDQLANEGF